MDRKFNGLALILLILFVGIFTFPLNILTSTAAIKDGCVIKGKKGTCEDQNIKTMPLPIGTNAENSPVPYWTWFEISCSNVGASHGTCDNLLVWECKTPGGKDGRWWLLMRQDFRPEEIAPRQIGVRFCSNPDELPDPERPDPEVPLSAFQEFEFAAPPLTVQPSPNTLIKMNTNVYSKKFDQSFTMELLGKQIVVTAYPVEFTFDYGDGTTLTTTDPGGPLRQEQYDGKTATSHVYEQTGTYRPTVTVTYRGEYSVEGKTPKPVDGYAVITSDPVVLDVWKAKIRNVDKSCLQDPTAWGCELFKK